MNILVDCHVFDGKFQGTRTYIQGLYSEMVKHRNIEFYFAARNIVELKNIFGTTNNVHYVKLGATSSIKRLVLEFPQIIKRYNIDYAHFQYISPIVKKCKEIVTIHDLLFMDFPQYFPVRYRIKNRLLFKKSAHRADILLTVSEYSRDEIVRHFRIDANKIAVTPNAVLPVNKTIVLPYIYDKAGVEKYILTVGRIEPRKNFLLLLRAFIELELYKEGYKLVIIGTEDLDYAEFYHYYSSLNHEEKQSVVMNVASFPELVSLYKHASLFVFPSLAEGFGIPPLEAVEYGCPLLCSNATAMAEFALPDECMFSPNDIEELKIKMNAALHAPVTINKSLIGSKFDWKKSADILCDKLNI